MFYKIGYVGMSFDTHVGMSKYHCKKSN